MELIQYFKRSTTQVKSNIQLATEGDKDAFVAIISEQLTSMYRVSKGILSNEHDVEDSISSTITIAFNKINTLKEKNYFKTWLIRILINECNNIYKKRKPLESLDENINNEYSISYNYDDNLDLYKAIEALPPDIYLVLILFYFEDMSYHDIANTLNLSEGTVKSRLHRGKEKLSSMIKEI